MAMANLLTNTSSMNLTPNRLSSSRPKSSYYTTRTFSFTLPLIHAVKPVSPLIKVNVKPVSALIKGYSGFGGNMNASDCFGSNSLLFWNDLNQFKCHGTKTDVADVEEEKQSNEPNNHRSKRKFGSRPYAIIVGASFCVILGICSLRFPNLIQPSQHMSVLRLPNLIQPLQHMSALRLPNLIQPSEDMSVLRLPNLIQPLQHMSALRLPNLMPPSYHMSVPYSDFIRGIQNGSVIRVQFEEDTKQIYFNTKSLQDQDIKAPENDLFAGSTNTKSLQDQDKEAPEDDLLEGSTDIDAPENDLLAGFTNSKSLQDQNTEAPKNDLLAGSTNTSLPKWHYHTTNVNEDRFEVIKMCKEKGITFGSYRALLSPSMKNFLLIFFQVTPFWIMVLITFYQLNSQHNLAKILKRKPSKKQSVTFDDVRGVDAAKTELLEIILCMKGDTNYTKLGAKLPKGVLLTGPPGTGKTLLARAVAGEADVAFFSISASELVEVFVGRGAARVRELFHEARKNSPSIIFIDEIDGVGGQRGSTLNCERDQTLNQLLTEMDGFEKESNVVVIAATNRPETLDSALMRPGRFSRKVRVDVPDENGRKDIFALYIKDVPMEDDKEAISELVALLTNGLVGADLENIARESVLLAARRGGEFVTEDDILQAVDRAKTKVYDDVPETKGPTMRDFVQGGSLGFGFSN